MSMNNYISALPDAYRKDESSNNYKLLQLEQRLVQGLRDDISATDKMLDIFNATGKTLELYGEMYGQPRGALTDESYRYIILQRIARNLAQGSYNSIVNALSIAFGVSANEIRFIETENDCEVKMENMPYDVLLKAGISAGQLRQIILSTLPVGIYLAPIQLEGTFEFGTTNMEYDEEKGLGNVDQTIGGFFGYLITNDIEIPE